MQRGLQLQGLSKGASSSLIDLAATTVELDVVSDWLDLVERETGHLMAMTRLAAEKRKEDGDHGEI